MGGEEGEERVEASHDNRAMAVWTGGCVEHVEQVGDSVGEELMALWTGGGERGEIFESPEGRRRL